MIYKTLGRSGLKVSGISLGSWRTFGQSVDDKNTDACMSAAYDAGVNYFDGAEAYGAGAAEEAMGRVFKKKDWPRDTLVISSKVISVGEHPNQKGLSRKHLVEACDAALRRMHLDYVDLFFCHRPDPDTPAEEIVHTMNELIQRGKIFYWGTSMFSAEEITELFAVAERDHLVGPTMEQCVHNMLNRAKVEDELVPIFAQHGLGTTIYSPLAVGILTGKYNDGIPEDSAAGQGGWLKDQLTDDVLDGARKVTAIADELGIKTSQLALAWCLKNPNVSTAIVGATKASQVEENVAASDHVESLTDAIMNRIADALA